MKEKRIHWDEIGPLLAGLLAIVFYGGLFIWLDIQESGGFAAMFQDHDKMLTKALMALARLAQLL